MGVFLVRGSGSIAVENMTGAFEANVSGSGRIDVSDGRAASFQAAIAGSGDISFGGIAVDPIATISGSGNVFIGTVEGDIRSSTSGSGRVIVGR